MYALLIEINAAVENASGCLDPLSWLGVVSQTLLRSSDRSRIRMPTTEEKSETQETGEDRQIKIPGSLKDFGDDFLRFMDNQLVLLHVPCAHAILVRGICLSKGAIKCQFFVRFALSCPVLVLFVIIDSRV
jgi:hypothetical protein